MFENVIRTSDDDCYHDLLLPNDMENMGFIFEYCYDYVKEDFEVEIDKLKFLNSFMLSVCRFQMELGHPRLITQAGRDTIYMFVTNDCKGDVSSFLKTKDTNNDFFEYQLYWVGETYAYLHWYYKMPSYEILKRLPLEDMLRLYFVGHEISRENFIEKTASRFKK